MVFLQLQTASLEEPPDQVDPDGRIEASIRLKFQKLLFWGALEK